MDYTVNLSWDNEADVWVAQSDDIPGLILESGSFDALIERVRFAIVMFHKEWQKMSVVRKDE